MTLASLPRVSEVGENGSRSEFRFPVASPQDLPHLVDRLRAAHDDGDEFSQGILVSSPLGHVEVAVSWYRSDREAKVSVSSAGGSRHAYLVLAFTLAAGAVAAWDTFDEQRARRSLKRGEASRD